MIRSSVLAAGLLFAGAIWAHDLRVMGGKEAKVGDDVTVYVTLAHAEPIDEPVETNQLENYLLVSPSNSKRPLDKRKGGSLHDATIKLEERGVYQALATTTATVQTKMKGDDGKHRHFDGTKEQAKKANPQATVVSAVKTQQYGKTLIVAGRPEKGVEASGLPFEIIPLGKPTSWKAGSVLRLQVLYNDRPLPNATLTANPIGFGKPTKSPAVTFKHEGEDDEPWAKSAKAGRDGIAELVVDEPGRWVFQVEQVIDAAPVHRERYDKENYVTSLTMEIHE